MEKMNLANRLSTLPNFITQESLLQLDIFKHTPMYILLDQHESKPEFQTEEFNTDSMNRKI